MWEEGGRIITIAITVNVTVTFCERDDRVLPPTPIASSIHLPTDWNPVLAHRFVLQQYLYSSVIKIYIQWFVREIQMHP